MEIKPEFSIGVDMRTVSPGAEKHERTTTFKNLVKAYVYSLVGNFETGVESWDSRNFPDEWQDITEAKARGLLNEFAAIRGHRTETRANANQSDICRITPTGWVKELTYTLTQPELSVPGSTASFGDLTYAEVVPLYRTMSTDSLSESELEELSSVPILVAVSFFVPKADIPKFTSA